MSDIDPIALGQAGLQALALAGTAILARHARIAERPDRMSDLEAYVPQAEVRILRAALGAFAEPAPAASGVAERRRMGDAMAAMCLRARTALARAEHLAGGAPPARRGPFSARESGRDGWRGQDGRGDAGLVGTPRQPTGSTPPGTGADESYGSRVKTKVASSR